MIRVVLFGKANVTDFGFVGPSNRQTYEAEGYLCLSFAAVKHV
jgi:hypothetical protein